VKLHFEGARLVDPANGVDRPLDLWVSDGRIAALGVRPEGFRADTVIHARGRILCPGLVDLSAHPREPGQEHKATIASEARAAAAGGITTFCCPPDTDPVVDTPAVVELLRRRAAAADGARLVPLGALTRGLAGTELSEMAALAAAGCPGVAEVRPVADTQVLRRAMEYAATFDLAVHLRPEDHWLARGGCVHEGGVAARLGLPGIPTAAETAALARDLALVEETGARVHFCRLSSAAGARLVAAARERGLPVTADCAMHQLFLTESALEGFDGQCHVRPPLRSAEDRAALRQAVADGVIGAICSDHQPHEAEAKLAPFPATAPGISAVDTFLALGLELVRQGVLDLSTLIDRISTTPAAILGREAGSLSPGSPADLCLIDPDAEWRLTATAMHSRGHNSPFLGQTLRGRVEQTWVGGRCVWRHGAGAPRPAGTP